MTSDKHCAIGLPHLVHWRWFSICAIRVLMSTKGIKAVVFTMLLLLGDQT
ncbi:unnamed protein product [Strongylus vulgaris]|uniref:Uncharacterized protein n=1 Tax=Strongylus vulgaris TaxID=40348 RepID=A0A3P7KXN1_STRVU|nr:unnamed protein product [Strongylus vulgaris]